MNRIDNHVIPILQVSPAMPNRLAIPVTGAIKRAQSFISIAPTVNSVMPAFGV